MKEIRWPGESIECEPARPVNGLLVFPQVPYPGWEVRVNGEERPLTGENGLIAVKIRGRGRKVAFYHRPLSVIAGFLPFLAGPGAPAPSDLLSRRKNRRREKPAS